MLGDIKQVSTDALHELRHALGTLRDDDGGAPTRPTPSLQTLPDLVAQARRSGLPVTLHMRGSPAALPTTVQVALYRIVQEGLTNVLRHAGGAHATVRIVVGAGQVEVDVTDDGTGAPTALSATGSGSGLIGMRDRTTALGGVFEAGQAAGGGFRVRAVLPVEEPAA
jgi:signal transduction histidine kinase